MTARFIAVAGYVNRSSADNRRLAHSGIEPIQHAWNMPMPLLMQDLSDRRTYPVGRIDRVGIIGDQIVLTGILLEDRPPELDAQLTRGVWFMNLDMDDIQERDIRLTELPGGGLLQTFCNWRVRAATIGDSPAWDLPPALVWTED